MDKTDILRKIEKNKMEIRKFGVKKLELFGSYARDENKLGSDIDFLVEFKQGRGLFDDYSGLRNYLKSVLGKEIDLVKPALLREELKPYIIKGKKIEAKIQ